MSDREETPDIMNELLSKRKTSDSIPARQQDSEPVIRQGESIKKQSIKATFYLYPEDVLLLENIRLKRIKNGLKPGDVDKSSLIREAIKLLARQ